MTVLLVHLNTSGLGSISQFYHRFYCQNKEDSKMFSTGKIIKEVKNTQQLNLQIWIKKKIMQEWQASFVFPCDHIRCQEKCMGN